MSDEHEVEGELVVQESAVAKPSAKTAKAALETYLQIQKVFDQQMPEAIMEIKGKRFRKKSYWRAIATAFRVEARLISEERVEHDGDWGYTATYRAVTADGRQCDGDGACMASEKVDRDGKPTVMQTIHNVRAHAHTRAKNRAIADLVGFGEVSADELGPDAFGGPPPPPQQRPQSAPAHPRQDGVKPPSDKQLAMLKARSYAQAEELGETTGYDNIHEYAAAIRKAAMAQLGFEKSEDLTFAAVTPMVKAIEAAVLGEDGKVLVPDGGVF